MPNPTNTFARILILKGEWQDVRGKNILSFVCTSDKPGKMKSHLQSEFKNKPKIIW